MGLEHRRLYDQLTELLPEARVIRMDVDTTRKRCSRETPRDFGSGKADNLLGTQMIAMGLDFPNVYLGRGLECGYVLEFYPDFRSAERTFQLLTQVAGRAGRADNKEGGYYSDL